MAATPQNLLVLMSEHYYSYIVMGASEVGPTLCANAATMSPVIGKLPDRLGRPWGEQLHPV